MQRIRIRQCSRQRIIILYTSSPVGVSGSLNTTPPQAEAERIKKEKAKKFKRIKAEGERKGDSSPQPTQNPSQSQTEQQAKEIVEAIFEKAFAPESFVYDLSDKSYGILVSAINEHIKQEPNFEMTKEIKESILSIEKKKYAESASHPGQSPRQLIARLINDQKPVHMINYLQCYSKCFSDKRKNKNDALFRDFLGARSFVLDYNDKSLFEDYHQVIQPMFPNRDKGLYHPFHYMKDEIPDIGINLTDLLNGQDKDKAKDFIDTRLEYADLITVIWKFKIPKYLEFNHNFLRMTRVMKCLKLMSEIVDKNYDNDNKQHNKKMEIAINAIMLYNVIEKSNMGSKFKTENKEIMENIIQGLIKYDDVIEELQTINNNETVSQQLGMTI